MIEEILNKNPKGKELADELIEVLNYMDELGNWEEITPEERSNLMEEKWLEIKKNKILGKLNIGEAILLEALEVPSGYSKLDLKKLLVKVGDIGEVAEMVLSKPKQIKLGDYL